MNNNNQQKQPNSQQSNQQNIRFNAANGPDDAYFDTKWELLKNAIQQILIRKNNDFRDFSIEELFRNVYNMVLFKHADRLYNGLIEVVREHLQTMVRDVVIESINGRFLETLNRVWTDHTTSMVMIRDIFKYLDRVHVSQAGIVPVYPLGLSIFRQEIIDYPPINEHMKTSLLGMISLERQKEIIECIDLKNVFQMLIALGQQEITNSRAYYENQFESLFLRETADFYRRASQKFLAENSASVYVRKVNECLTEEVQRSERYLDKITEAKVIHVLNDELISKNMAALVEMENSGLAYMLQYEKIQDLRCLYELLIRVPNGIETITNTMKQIIQDKCSMITVSNANNTGRESAVSMIRLKEQFNRFLLDAFSNNHEIKNCIEYEFEYFLNKIE